MARYAKEFTSTLQKESRQEYEKLIPEIPYIKESRAKMLNSFLLITSQELAAYKAMKKHGKPPGEVWELCHEALRYRLAEIPEWKQWSLKHFMFSIEEGKIESFLRQRGLKMVDHLDKEEIERRFLLDENGSVIGQITGVFRFVLASLNE